MVAVATDRPLPIDQIPGSARLRRWWRPAALIASLIAAYALPLSNLVQAMGYDTPLAYLGLVPPLAFALGCWQHHRNVASPASPTLRDAAVGGAFLILAALIGAGAPVLFAPSVWSRQFDLTAFPLFAARAHLDLLSLPFFAAGMLVLLFGRAALGWAWPAIGYTFLVWPVPYTFLLGHLLPLVSNATAWTAGRLSGALPLGATVSPADGTLFTVATPHGPQVVSIGSTCSGFNSFVAWLLLAGAVSIIVRRQRGGGHGLRRAGQLALWVLAGAAATLLGNIIRIMLLFAAVHRSGLSATFDWVHASLGNVLFALIVLGMFALLPWFGLALPQPTHAALDQTAPSSRVIASSSHAPLLVFISLALTTGMFLNVGILHLALIVVGACLLLCLSVFAISARSHDVNERTPHPHAILLATGVTVVMAGALILSWYLNQARIAQLPSMGWRIDQGQRGLMTGQARHITTLVFGIATLIAGRSAIRALRRCTDPVHIVGGRPLPSWSGMALAATAIIAGTVVLGITTVTVAPFKANVATGATVSVADFDAALPELPGMQRTFVEAYDWPKQSLGKTATYNRYQYAEADGQPVWVDVLTTADADALAYHSVPTCYAFHGFEDRGVLPLVIGEGGAMAQIVNYIKPAANEAWSTLYWEQKVMRGGKTFYQRIVLLYRLDHPIGDATSARFGPNNALLQGYATRLLDRLGAQ